LQWDALALAKSRSFAGVLAHCLIVTAVTCAFALPFSQNFWWSGIILISLTHFVIDAAQLWYKPTIPPLARYLLDQLLHFAFIFIALIWGNFLDIFTFGEQITAVFNHPHIRIYLLAYAFITMPAWVLLKFLAYGLVAGTAPNFPEGTNKYVGIIERVLITTFVTLGQFLLIPLIALPRLALEWPKMSQEERGTVHLVELLGSTALAIAIGLALSRMG
jgi:hypothetical protein